MAFEFWVYKYLVLALNHLSWALKKCSLVTLRQLKVEGVKYVKFNVKEQLCVTLNHIQRSIRKQIKET